MSLDTKITTGEEDKEKAKQEFFKLVDGRQYKQALEFYNQLDFSKKIYISGDKMGVARLKEIKFNL